MIVALTMDNMTGKETAVLIIRYIIDPICMAIHISTVFTYLTMVWSRCSQISEGQLYMEKVYSVHAIALFPGLPTIQLLNTCS